MEKVFVAQRVARKLFATEAAVDGAMVEAAELLGEMLKARKDVNASLVFADDVQVKMMEAMKALSEARTAMVGVHNELNEAKLRLGVVIPPSCADYAWYGEMRDQRRVGTALKDPTENPIELSRIHVFRFDEQWREITMVFQKDHTSSARQAGLKELWKGK